MRTNIKSVQNGYKANSLLKSKRICMYICMYKELNTVKLDTK